MRRRTLRPGRHAEDPGASRKGPIEEARWLQLSDGQPLNRELESFFDAVADGSPPAVTAADGLAAIEAADAIVEAIKSHRWDGKPDSPVGLAGPQLIS